MQEEPTGHWLAGEAALLVFLLFLYFPVAQLVQSPPAPVHLALVVVGLAAFVGVYLSLMLVPGLRIARGDEWLRLALLAALALALGLDDSADWAPLFVYVAAVCGFRLPDRRALVGIAACTAGAALVGAVAGYERGDLLQYTIYSFAIGLMLLAFSHALRSNAELRAARQELARLAVAEERLRFARDLHDLLGHSLSLIALKSELAGRLLENGSDGVRREVTEIQQVAREALTEVREAVGGYRRMTLVDELAGARLALQAAGIEATVEPPGVALPPETESILAWAVREGTTNVIRHSGATRCEIRVRAGLAAADVEVVDDGRGADTGDGSGLAGLAERARARHGRVEAGRRPEGGFRLRVSVPTA